MNNFKPSLSDILSELLQRKGLSISEIARRTNIPQPTIYRIAQGEHQRPHKKTLKALSDYFNVSIDQLIGLEPIDAPSSSKPLASRLPILNCKQATDWPKIKNSNFDHVIFDKKISALAYALRMPDKSMEPLITKDAILIIDPEKKPEYRNIVVVKLHNYDEVLVRQLIKDANNCYIRPLSQDFDQFEMIMLSPIDSIKGMVVEARLNCEEL